MRTPTHLDSVQGNAQIEEVTCSASFRSAAAPVSHVDDQHLDRHLDKLQRELPDRPSAWLHRLRAPGARWVRMPIGILLICGGFLGFLPVLGFWMLPLGLVLLSLDVPILKHPAAQALDWLDRRWTQLRDRAKAKRVGG
jgi:hypothetical protein